MTSDWKSVKDLLNLTDFWDCLFDLECCERLSTIDWIERQIHTASLMTVREDFHKSKVDDREANSRERSESMMSSKRHNSDKFDKHADYWSLRQTDWLMIVEQIRKKFCHHEFVIEACRRDLVATKFDYWRFAKEIVEVELSEWESDWLRFAKSFCVTTLTLFCRVDETTIQFVSDFSTTRNRSW